MSVFIGIVAGIFYIGFLVAMFKIGKTMGRIETRMVFTVEGTKDTTEGIQGHKTKLARNQQVSGGWESSTLKRYLEGYDNGYVCGKYEAQLEYEAQQRAAAEAIKKNESTDPPVTPTMLPNYNIRARGSGHQFPHNHGVDCDRFGCEWDKGGK